MISPSSISDLEKIHASIREENPKQTFFYIIYFNPIAFRVSRSKELSSTSEFSKERSDPRTLKRSNLRRKRAGDKLEHRVLRDLQNIHSRKGRFLLCCRSRHSGKQDERSYLPFASRGQKNYRVQASFPRSEATPRTLKRPISLLSGLHLTCILFRHVFFAFADNLVQIANLIPGDLRVCQS